MVQTFLHTLCVDPGRLCGLEEHLLQRRVHQPIVRHLQHLAGFLQGIKQLLKLTLLGGLSRQGVGQLAQGLLVQLGLGHMALQEARHLGLAAIGERLGGLSAAALLLRICGILKLWYKKES